MSIFQRIWKYRFHYLIVVPALLYLFLFKIYPWLTGLYMTFIDYKPFLGYFESEWVSLNNYDALFNGDIFGQLLRNTLVMKLGYMIASGLLAFAVAVPLSLVRPRFLQAAFATLFLVPYFIPSSVLGYLTALVLSPQHSPFGQLETMALGELALFPFIIILTETFKTCGIPIALALAAINARHAALARAKSGLGRHSFAHTNVWPALRTVVAFLLLQMTYVLSGDFELLYELINPLVYQTGDTIETFLFRAGLMNAEYSLAATLQMIQFIIQLLFAWLAYLLVKRYFLHDLFHGISVEGKQPLNPAVKGGGSAIGIIVSILYSVVVLLALYLLFIYPFTVSSTGEEIGAYVKPISFINYLVLGIAASVFHMIMTAMLAFPLTVRRLPGRGIYAALLVALAVTGSSIVYEYMTVRQLEMVNTFVPIFCYGLIGIVPVFVLKSIFNSRYSELKQQAEANGKGEAHAFIFIFIPKVWKPLLALGVLQFIAFWNSYLYSFVFMASEDRYSPIMQFKSMYQSGADPVTMLKYGAIVSILPIALFLIFRRWITSEVLLGQVRKL